jgi:CDP-glucose 4,6-dehydratase
VENLVINPTFWKDRKVLITGHTGFKGSWLTLWLSELGAKVKGFAIDTPNSPSIFQVANIKDLLQESIQGDIRDLYTIRKVVQSYEPEIVIHMAAQSLVRNSYTDPVSTYSTNVMGTVNILEAVRTVPNVKAVLNITTDKCYENKEWIWGYRENEQMGGQDPYSNSKGCSELVSSAYRKSFLQKADIALATARSGNVIGGGDWSKDRIVPDAMNAFMKNKILLVRNPEATRPWQHVLEPLSGYLMLCQQLITEPKFFADSWNFGPNYEDVKPVSTLANIIVNNWGGKVQWELDDGVHPHEAHDLKLDCSKSNKFLKWSPSWGLERGVYETVRWYKAFHKKENMYKFSLNQIRSYQQELNKK